jgi:hypothetical protein
LDGSHVDPAIRTPLPQMENAVITGSVAKVNCTISAMGDEIIFLFEFTALAPPRAG